MYRHTQTCTQRGWCSLTALQWWDQASWKLKTSPKTCMQEVMLCFSYSWGWEVILQLSISHFLIDPCFFPESDTTFQLKMLSSQDQIKSFGSFHILLLILWIILSFLCTFCLISLMFLNCSEFLAWKNIILKLKLFPVYHFRYEALPMQNKVKIVCMLSCSWHEKPILQAQRWLINMINKIVIFHLFWVIDNLVKVFHK